MVSLDIRLVLTTTVLLSSSWLLYGADGAAADTCVIAKEIRNIQTLCKKPNEALLSADQHRNPKRLCKSIIMVLKCVAENITKCYDQMHQNMELYFHSPYYCELTTKHIMEIQSIIKRSNRRSKPTSNPVSAETTEPDDGDHNNNNHNNNNHHSPQPTLPPGITDAVDNNNSSSGSGGGDGSTINSTSSSSSPSNIIKDKDGGEGSKDKGYKVTGGGEGSSEEHTGSKSKQNKPNSATSLTIPIVLVTIATVLSTIMTSSPT